MGFIQAWALLRANYSKVIILFVYFGCLMGWFVFNVQIFCLLVQEESSEFHLLIWKMMVVQFTIYPFA